MIQVKDKKFEIYIPGNKIRERIRELGQQISRDYAGEQPVLVGVLNGVYMFFSELTKAISIDIEVSFTRYASYHAGTTSSGEVKKLIGFNADNIKGRDIIIVEDIIDTGLTMNKLLQDVQEFSPRSVKVASLLHKPEALQKQTKIDYLGFEIENKFVVGFGLDYDELGRNLTDLYVLKK